MAHRALDVAALADAELADATPRRPLPGQRSRRLHVDARGDRVHRRVRPDHLRPGAHQHEGDIRTRLHGSRPIRRLHGPGCVVVRRSDPRQRRLQPPRRSRRGGRGSRRDRDADRDGLPLTTPARRARRPHRRRLGDRCAARRRDPPDGPFRDTRRGRARATAPALPRPRHLLVDGRGGRARRTLRRGRRPRSSAPRSVTAAHRHARAGLDRRQHAAVREACTSSGG